MGYFVTYEGDLTYPRADEDRIVEALRNLNHRHELKSGGRHPRTGDPYEDLWFSWLPSRWHEDEGLTVKSILELVGFSVDERMRYESPLTLAYSISYDNKTGDEEVFLTELAKFASIDLYCSGEDGDKWRYLSKPDGELYQYHGYTSYDDLAPTKVTVAIRERAEYRERSLAEHEARMREV